ncbi:penicillin-binding protein 1C [Cyclonatronum proteinivorum]|uniref:peptidoglycan glycosyltransferase n=1 Tax=Cyclonatronum proteinivorum TaxID=1457365 RepID=A0A345UMY5_9BACT|nr:penicillin-binding protein 1C [Cyclonatronum proteinivorum]AXJ01837.1 penicillin-binding protein 1C [Cyclonatronum proteinivorum]
MMVSEPEKAVSVGSYFRFKGWRKAAWWLLPPFLLIIAFFAVPVPEFDVPYSTVVYDREGELLAARISDDGQWRFPPGGTLPDRYLTALLYFEDKRFMQHRGVDVRAIGRAVQENLHAGRIVSGGSTISMQLARLAETNPPRTLSRKLFESLQALRLENRYSKAEILQLYAAHAPFGGNVVGLEAASWRYFGREAGALSWAEAATLAVLPNAPALMHPGRNREQLQRKRDWLLQQLYEAGHFDALTLQLAQAETLPEVPLPLPQLAPHLLTRILAGGGNGTQRRTTLDAALQRRAAEVVVQHNNTLRANEIHNMAVLIAEVETGRVLAYIGNTPEPEGQRSRGHAVDIIRAPRSTGSMLKPPLYALMLHRGMLLPNTLIPDIPTQVAGYHPQNFSRTYRGAVPAAEVVSRSLNVPSVRMLQDFGLPDFHHYLQELGLTTITRPANHYGLTLILGGAEASLWDVAGMYASLGRHLLQYDARLPAQAPFQARPLRFTDSHRAEPEPTAFPLSHGAVWAMMEAMQNVNRPVGETDWRRFASARRVAWKTGTSFGYRDAWSVGLTPRHVVAVWAGNAGGEGRPGLTGVEAAAPVMFSLFGLLEDSGWFAEPVFSLQPVEVCRISGHRAGPDCSDTVTQAVPLTALETPACPYHQAFHADPETGLRVNSSCFPPENMTRQTQFVLPADRAHFYRANHPGYRPLPPWKPGCEPQESPGMAMALIYPTDGAEIYIPYELDGGRGKTVFEAVHEQGDVRLYWHLNEEFAGSTQGIHQLAVTPEPGRYRLTLVDEHGQQLTRRFTIMGDLRP